MRWIFLVLARIYLFFFSSRRRHTRYWRDWSSDVCSSDLDPGGRARPRALRIARARDARGGGRAAGREAEASEDRKSVVEGKSVDLGGRRIIKQTNHHQPADGYIRR